MTQVSVVIPSYNHAAFIAEAVESVLAQTHHDLELIVVDDGSRDNSLKILERVSDSRLKVIPQENQGAHAAINRGLHAATGEYLSILNSDDSWHPQRLEKLLAVVETDPEIVLAGTYIEIIDSHGKSLGIKHGYRDCPPWLLEDESQSFRAQIDDSSAMNLHTVLLTENYFATTSNYLFPRCIFERVGDLRPLRYIHDWDLALRLAEEGKLFLLPEPLMRYRLHDENTIRENQAAMIFEICWLLALHLPQQIAAPWFQDVSLAQRVNQLLHSIHVAGCERALSILMAYHLNENTSLALQLLDPQNEARQKLIEFITHHLAEQTVQPHSSVVTRIRDRLHVWQRGLHR